MAAGATAPAAKGGGGIVSQLTPRFPRRQRSGAADTASTATARQVWVLREGTPVAVAVTPGISDGRMTEIVSGDLKEGMQVITDQRARAK
jgi:HlyD family secretion protein